MRQRLMASKFHYSIKPTKLRCVDAYRLFLYDLGTAADANLEARLPSDQFTLGFRSEVRDDPVFDHIDYIGYPEQVDGRMEQVTQTYIAATSVPGEYPTGLFATEFGIIDTRNPITESLLEIAQPDRISATYLQEFPVGG